MGRDVATAGPLRQWRRLLRPGPESEGLRLDGADEARRLRPLPRSFVAAASSAPCNPPALARYPVALPNHKHRKLRLAPRFRFLVHCGEYRAQRAHLGPRKCVAQLLQHLGVGERCAAPRCRDEDLPNLRRRCQRLGLGTQPEDWIARRPSVPPLALGVRRMLNWSRSDFCCPTMRKASPSCRAETTEKSFRAGSWYQAATF